MTTSALIVGCFLSGTFFGFFLGALLSRTGPCPTPGIFAIFFMFVILNILLIAVGIK